MSYCATSPNMQVC